MWVVIRYFEFEFVGGIFPVSRVGCDGNFKDGEIVGVGEVDVGYFSSVKFGNICTIYIMWDGWVGEDLIDFCCALLNLILLPPMTHTTTKVTAINVRNNSYSIQTITHPFEF